MLYLQRHGREERERERENVYFVYFWDRHFEDNIDRQIGIYCMSKVYFKAVIIFNGNRVLQCVIAK